MAWDGQERRLRKERRVVERRRSMNYNSQTVVVVEGVTWIDAEGADRRRSVRRRADRERLASIIIRVARP
ncbi:MAG TPA: hypothetical protein VNH22_12095 [Blastocatellia bacterium]|jgi:hypothetical protein|nr:hypothetical protein [Blastocatellia bacterium]